MTEYKTPKYKKLNRFEDQTPYEFRPIGVVRTCYHEKFGIPRQPGLVESARGTIEIIADPDMVLSLRTLEQFSHLWLLFVFHETGTDRWRPQIRPPRLGGVKKVGVLASRSPHRPNPIGISVVKIESMDLAHEDGPRIEVSGVDLMDGTPLLDLKPYIPYADCVPEANPGWAAGEIPRIAVTFTPEAEAELRAIEAKTPTSEDSPSLRTLIFDTLTIDPRPTSQRRKFPAWEPQSQGLKFGMFLLEYDVQYEIVNGGFVVTSIPLAVDSPAGAAKRARLDALEDDEEV